MITIKNVSLTKEVLEQIRQIDLQFYPNIGSIDWYLARYKPWHSAFLALDDDRIIGYVAALPARRELYDAILDGILIDDMGINPAMFVKESEYYYAGSVLIEKEYRGLGISKRLLDQFSERYAEKKLCLIAVNSNGYRLASHYFAHWKRIAEGVDVFVSRG